MNRKLLSGLLVLAFAWGAFGRTELFYENDGLVLVPPEIAPNIDATNFVNQGQFIINLTNFIPFLPPSVIPYPYEIKRGYNYTNTYGAFMSCNTGFRFETFVQDSLPRLPAANFHNEGSINCGTADTSNVFSLAFFRIIGTSNVVLSASATGAKLLLRATNIFNEGELNMGFEGLIQMWGDTVSLDRGGINMEQNGISQVNGNVFFNGGIFDGYWGLSTNSIFGGGISPAAYFNRQPPITPPHLVTNRVYQNPIVQLGGPTFASYLVDELDASGSNRTVRAVFLSNTNANIQANVFFPIGGTVIEWTNTLGTSPENLYLFDTFGFTTNFFVLLNGFAGTRPTFIPYNYSLFTFPGGFFNFGGAASPVVIPPGTFNSSNTTNQYSAYEALFQPTSVVLGDNFGQTFSNSPGRIDISASDILSLNNSRVTSLNYLKLTSTNHFAGSAGAVISSPYTELNLRSTNGSFAITNVLVPSLPRNEGVIDLYSARWTNVVGTVTNNYHVLFVDTKLAPHSPTRIGNMTLTCTNLAGGPDQIILSDVLNILSNNATIDCSRLTITTNAPGAPTLTGGINFMDASIVWSNMTPRLQYFTNYGFVNAPNTEFFRGSRRSPYYSSSYNEPYFTFVNAGGVTNFSSRIYATNFINSGVFSASNGRIELHQANQALLTNGMFLATAPAGAVVIEANTLLTSNCVIRAGADISLSVTNLLDDGSVVVGADNVTNKNAWTSGNGFNLFVTPTNGSLLGTTIQNTAADNRQVRIQWAGRDLGNTPSGYVNNSAIGRVILAGGTNCSYRFMPVSGTNAIYIDLLDLRGFVATNSDGAGNWASLTCDPNMTVYYGQALADGSSIAEKLAQVNNGRFQWASNYNTGFFSSTNMIYPDGTTNRLNAALTTACDIDSDGDGLVNCIDPSPIAVFSAANIAMSVSYASQPSLAAQVSWNLFPATTNSLFAAPAFDSTNWTLVTNFVYPGPYVSRATVSDPIKTNAPRFYRVRVGLK